MPALTAIGIFVLGYGAIYGWPLAAVGALILFVGVSGWANEPLSE